MASNPPFQLEDTDEDFFDKLVNDDDDDAYKVATNLPDGDDFDDAKAFANLGIRHDAGARIQDPGKGEVESLNESVNSCINTAQTLVASDSFAFDSVGEEPNTETSKLEEPLVSGIKNDHTLVSSNSFAFDGPNAEVSRSEEPLDSTASQNHGSGDARGVKEVQWTAFTSKPMENGNNGFGSYNDFFTEFGDNLVEQTGERGELVSSQQNIVSSSSSVVDGSFRMESFSYSSHQVQEVQRNDGQDPNKSLSRMEV